MNLPQVCVAYLIRDGAEGQEVLLGRKRKGLGFGNWVGLGGKLESGESVAEAATREIFEESSLRVIQEDLIEVGTLHYYFPTKPTWSQHSTVFLCRRWTGVAAASDELIPAWFPIDQMPYGEMWEDAKSWLPAVLSGGRVSAHVTFGADLKTVVDATFASDRRSAAN